MPPVSSASSVTICFCITTISLIGMPCVLLLSERAYEIVRMAVVIAVFAGIGVAIAFFPERGTQMPSTLVRAMLTRVALLELLSIFLTLMM